MAVLVWWDDQVTVWITSPENLAMAAEALASGV